jgi:hypothetical protein
MGYDRINRSAITARRALANQIDSSKNRKAMKEEEATLLADAQKKLLQRAGFNPETISEQDQLPLLKMLSVLETQAAVYTDDTSTSDEKIIDGYALTYKKENGITELILHDERYSLSISKTENEQGVITTNSSFTTATSSYQNNTITPKLNIPFYFKPTAVPPKKIPHVPSKGKPNLLNNPFHLGVPEYKLVALIPGKGKIYVADSFLDKESTYNPEFGIYGGPEIVYKRNIKIESDSGQTIYIRIHGRNLYTGMTGEGYDNKKGNARLEIAIDGIAKDGAELHTYFYDEGEDVSLKELQESFSSKGIPASLIKQAAEDERYYDTVMAFASPLWKAKAIEKEEEPIPSENAVLLVDDPTQQEWDKMTVAEKTKHARSKFWEEFKVSTVLQTVAIGLGIALAIAGGIALAGGTAAAIVIGVIAGAAIGIGLLIYSTWNSVLKPLLTGNFDEIETTEAVKLALYLISIVAAAVGIVASIPALVTVGIIAFVAAIALGIGLTIYELNKAITATTPQEENEHTKKAARQAEQTTSDAIIGLIAKVFESLVKPKKPVIGEEKESVPTEKKKEVVAEEKEMVKEVEEVKDLEGDKSKEIVVKVVLSRSERLSMLKKSLSDASNPKNPKEALNLINRSLDDIESIHAGASDRMFGILDNKYVTYHADGSVTALTKGHRIEIQSNGMFRIFDRKTGDLFFSK